MRLQNLFSMIWITLTLRANGRMMKKYNRTDVDPEELASRMYDDVIESDLDVLREYQNQSRDDSATTQCMGY